MRAIIGCFVLVLIAWGVALYFLPEGKMECLDRLDGQCIKMRPIK
jgi:hypothetical protein